jgi:hypothetical protein
VLQPLFAIEPPEWKIKAPPQGALFQQHETATQADEEESDGDEGDGE